MGLGAVVESKVGREEAKDILQETCFVVIQAIRKNRVEHPSVIAYARATAIRIATDRAALLRRLILKGNEPFIIRQEPTQESDLIEGEQLRTFLELLAQLTPLDQQVIRRSCFEEQTHEEIERALGLKIGTSRQIKSYAVARMRALYQQSIPTEIAA